MKIEKFCSLLRRYSLKYEHYVICIEKRDLDEEQLTISRIEDFMEYFKEHCSEDEE